MKKKTRRVLMITAAAVPLLLFALMLYLASFVMTGKRQTIEEATQWQRDHYDSSFYDDLEKTDYTVESYDGYALNVQFLKNPVPTDKYMIISHGYTDNRMGAVKYVSMYLELDFNCIIYDLRGHGENEKTFTTYGIREGRDIAELVKDTRERYSDISQLGLHGESLGAASTVTSLKYEPDIDFAISDCGFSDIDNVLRGTVKKAHLPGLLVDLADIGARIRYGYAIKNMRPIDSLDNNEIPILFIHGSEDDFILPKNSVDMASRTKGKSALHYIDGAGHARSVLTDPESYKKYVKDFLSGI